MEVVNEIMAEFHNDHKGKLPYFKHVCNTDCCNGLQTTYHVGIGDGQALGAPQQERLNVIIIDGNEALCTQCCSVAGCNKLPTSTTLRFCEDHHALEDQCAFCLSIESAQFCNNQAAGGSKFCAAHQHYDQLYGERAQFRRPQERRAGAYPATQHHYCKHASNLC